MDRALAVAWFVALWWTLVTFVHDTASPIVFKPPRGMVYVAQPLPIAMRLQPVCPAGACIVGRRPPK